jgi:hypothetical protein
MSKEEYIEKLKEFLENELIGKKSEFVNMLLTWMIENEIDGSFLKEFLDIKRLIKLYNNEAVILDFLKFLFKRIKNFILF